MSWSGTTILSRVGYICSVFIPINLMYINYRQYIIYISIIRT